MSATIVKIRPIDRGYAEVLVGLSETTLASATGRVPIAMAKRYAAAQTSGDHVAGDAVAEEIDTWREGGPPEHRVPAKKRKRSGGPTAASLNRQEERLKRARAAETEARAQTEKAEEAERKAKANERAVEEAIKSIKTLRADVKTFKAHAKRHHAKAKAERAKAAKLARG